MSNTAVTTFDFGGNSLPVLTINNVQYMTAQSVGKALGYKKADTIGRNIRSRWADDFREGTHYIVVKHGDEDFKGATSSLEVAPGTTQIMLVSFRGAQRASMMARTKFGSQFRDFLEETVIPFYEQYAGRSTPPPQTPQMDEAMIARIVGATVKAILPTRS